PREAVEMIAVEESRLWRAQGDENIPGVAAEDGTVGHVGEAEDGDAAGAHLAREVVARPGGAGRNPVRARVGVDVDPAVAAEQGRRVGEGRLRRRRGPRAGAGGS